MTIAERLAAVRERIDEAAAKAARNPDSIRLMAVSKTQPVEAIQQALAAGQLLFGENKAQELASKADALGRKPEWHFIGHLQRNKVRFVVDRVSMIHSVDSVRLASEINKRTTHPVEVLVQVNTSREESKGGVPPDEAMDLCGDIMALNQLRLRGFMTIPQGSANPADAAPAFALLRRLAEEGTRAGLPTTELSMGMSHDLDVAVAEGATIIRVGTAIFGPRRS